MSILAEAPIYIDDAPTSTVLQMKAMSRRLQAERGLGLIIVDYLQLMEPLNPDASPVQQVSENSKALKALARELQVPVLAISQLSRAVEHRSPPIPKLADLRQSGCLAGDTLLTRADTGERIKIEDLVGKKNIPIYTLDDDWKLKVGIISKVFHSGKKRVYLLKTKSGFEIKASANHPFRKFDGWCPLEKLKIGDKIATAKKLIPYSPKNELSDEEIILLAHLLGDGCVAERQPIHYTSSNLKNIQIVAKLAKKLFKIKPRFVRQKNWCHVYLSSPYPLAPGKHHPIINWYRRLGLKPARSWEKVIPEAVFSLDKNKLALFLSHLWATDGNASEKRMKKRKTSAAIFYSTTSLRMAQGIKELLLRFEIRSKIAEQRKAGYRPCYEVRIQGKEHQMKFLKEIGIFGKEKIVKQLIKNLNEILPNTNLDVVPKEVWNLIDKIRMKKGLSWKQFCKNLGVAFGGRNSLFRNNVSFGRLKLMANHLSSPELLNLAEGDVFWDEIVSIEPLGIEDVYDLTIPKTHNFLANNIVVHNSIEQDADVVMFIYREDRYFQDTPRKGIADVIIAKHRNGPVGRVEIYFDERCVTFRNLEKGTDIFEEF
jgi:replicative DNA helicase